MGTIFAIREKLCFGPKATKNGEKANKNQLAIQLGASMKKVASALLTELQCSSSTLDKEKVLEVKKIMIIYSRDFYIDIGAWAKKDKFDLHGKKSKLCLTRKI